MFRSVSQKAEEVIQMKKFISFLLSALLVLSLAACESNGGARSNDSESSAGRRLPPKQSPLRPYNMERDHEIRYRYT